MKRMMILIIGFIVILILETGTPTASQVMATASTNESTRLVDAGETPINVTSSFEIPFSLVSMPQKAKLKINFLVDSKGRCSKTYKPTTISINKKRIEEIDFLRNYMKGEIVVHIITLPSEVLKIGENLIRIDMGSCQYGKDKMRLYYILLLPEP